jgi:divalent metal cation (Fe/Co/Zn/Cd) transporter
LLFYSFPFKGEVGRGMGFSLDFVDDVPVGEIERTVLGLEDEIKRRVPEVKKVFIEAEAQRISRRQKPR